MNHPPRRNWLVAAVVASLLTLGPIAVRGDDADDAREADKDLAKQGWVVDSLHLEGGDQPGVRHFLAVGRIRLPVDPVWLAMANQNDQDWPGLNDVVREYANGDTMISRYKLGVPIYADRVYRLRVVNDHPTRTMMFDQIPGYGNVKEIKGRWSTSALSDTLSLVTYDLYSDPGVKWIPGFIVNWVTKREIPHVFEHLYKAARNQMERTAGKNGEPESRSENVSDIGGR